MISRELGSTQLEPEPHAASGAMQSCLCCPSGGVHRAHHLLKHQTQLGSSRRPHMQEKRGLTPSPSSPDASFLLWTSAEVGLVMVRFQLCFLTSLSSSPFAVFSKTVALAMSTAELSHTRDGCILTTGK